MTTKKKILTTLSIALIAGLAFGVNFGLKYASIATSYVAKAACSAKFVSGLDISTIKTQEMYPASYVNVEIDTVNLSVTTDIYGLAKSKAIYRKGFGSTLVNSDEEEKELRLQGNLKITTKSLDTTELLHASIPSNIDSALFYQVIDDYFTGNKKLTVPNTRAVVVLYNGKIIAEKYAQGISPDMPLLGWSMAKSVTNAMIGIMVKDKKLDIYKPAPVKEWQNDERKKITIDELLRMSSGLEFEENYAKPCDATQMLFQEKSCGLYAMQSKLTSAPNSVYYYSSGTANILQEIIRQQFSNHADYLAFPYNRLFKKIGMESAVIETDPSGTFIGSSYMYATARDWAKFGQLYLQDGIWNGERILPEGWVKYSSTETPKSGGKYAALFWVEHVDKSYPQDAYFAEGHDGQLVAIIPSLNMVIVRLGCTPHKLFDYIGFVKDIVKSVKNEL